MSFDVDDDNVFSGVLGEQYHTLKLICPIATEMSRLVGMSVNQYCQKNSAAINVLELGGGTGITTLAMLSANQEIIITSIDNAPTMQQQAQQSLQKWSEEGRLKFVQQDALLALQAIPSESVDVIATAYTLHNFLNDYRVEILQECARILKVGGQFICGDRYGLDDISEHSQAIQVEVSRYFEILIAEKRLDLLEEWIVHLFADEAENRVMRETVALQQLEQAGFESIQLSHRVAVNALVTAIKSST